mgnify:CR=1 FL=1|jgi:hypothetical protein
MKPPTLIIIAACCLLFLCQPIYSQEDNNSTPDLNAEVYGNPYLIRDWSDGVVKFTSGRVVKQFKLRFDCVHNRLLLQYQGSTFAAESKINEFVIYTGKKKDSMIFRRGYPGVDKASENTFYQVLIDGKLPLLRLVAKNIVEHKDIVSTTTVKGHLEEADKYYLLKDGVMIHLPEVKEDILKALPDKAEALSAFIDENKLRFKSHEDYIRLATKYIELSQ